MAVPPVSVVLPVRNGASYVAQAVKSILDQTLHDLECIVVDDGSTDGTPRILQSFTADSRLRIITLPSSGLATALAAGCAESRGPLIARMDADDVALPERLATQVRFLATHSDVAVVGSDVELIGPGGQVVGRSSMPLHQSDVRRQLQAVSPFFHPTVVMRREVLDAVGGYRSVAVPAEDLDLWLRIAEHHDLANIGEPLLRYRLHPAQTTAQRFTAAAEATLAVRASARHRAIGADDPLNGVASLNPRMLEKLGVTRDDVVRAEFKLIRDQARLMYRVRCRRAAGALLLAAARHAARQRDWSALVQELSRGWRVARRELCWKSCPEGISGTCNGFEGRS